MILCFPNDLKLGKMPCTTKRAFLVFYVEGKTNKEDLRPTAHDGGVQKEAHKSPLSVLFHPFLQGELGV